MKCEPGLQDGMCTHKRWAHYMPFKSLDDSVACLSELQGSKKKETKET